MRHALLALTLALAAAPAVAVAQPAAAPAPAPAAARGKTTPVPGAPGLTQRDVPIRNACATSFRVIKRVRAGDDPALVAALTHVRLTGLDLAPDDPARARESLKRFQTWLDLARKRADAAVKVQTAAFTADGATARTRVEAAARVALVHDQLARLLGAVEIPANIRGMPEAVTVYCDTLAEQIEPLRARADEARGACAKAMIDGAVGPGWWSAVCVVPPAPASPPQP